MYVNVCECVFNHHRCFNVHFPMLAVVDFLVFDALLVAKPHLLPSKVIFPNVSSFYQVFIWK